MAVVIRTKRRWSGTGDAPATLASGELCYNGITDTLYIGFGDDGFGNATSVKVVAGFGASVMLTGDQVIAGLKTFSVSPSVPTATAGDNSTKAASTAFVKAAVDTAIAAVSVSDGDKGDITVAASGTTWTIDANAVTNAKLAQMPTSTFKGRVTAGTGDAEDLTVAQVKSMLGLTGTNSGDQTITLTGDVTGTGTSSFPATIGNDKVTNAKLANMPANTFKGNNTGATADPLDLTIAQVKTMLGITNVNDTADLDKPISTATQTALNGKINASEKGAANGVATLDANAKIPVNQLPALAISDTFVVASQASMLALTAEPGDVAIRTDISKSFILQTAGANVLANWKELLNPTADVASVFGRTGAIVAQTGDYSVGQVTGAAPLASPTFSGTPTAPTPTAGDNSTKIATTAFAAALHALTLKSANNLSDVANVGTARNNLGLGTIATQNANSVAITGGTIDGVSLDGGTY